MSFEKLQLSDSVTIYRGDCKEILPTLPSVDAVVTDPPYEITATGGGIGGRRDYLKETAGFTDCGFDYELLAAYRNWVVFGTLRQVPKLINAAGDRRWMLVTWNKTNPTPLCNGNYLPDTEYIIHAFESGRLYGEFRDRARFIVHPAGDVEAGTHPNEKPVRVMLKMVRLAADAGGVVLDPFMGSGTTGVACIRSGRKFIGIEIDPVHFETARRRLERELAQPMLPMTGSHRGPNFQQQELRASAPLREDHPEGSR